MGQICLIFIPSVSTREWALDIGYWQVAGCSFSLKLWKPTDTLAPDPPLVSAPMWVIIRDIPPQLYSLEGLSVIGSGIGHPMHTEHSRLNPVNVGEAKIKIDIILNKKRPDKIRVKDREGNVVTVKAEYLRVPPQCSTCMEFGHTPVFCPRSSGRTTTKRPSQTEKRGGESRGVERRRDHPKVWARTSAPVTGETTSVLPTAPRDHTGPVIPKSSTVTRSVAPFSEDDFPSLQVTHPRQPHDKRRVDATRVSSSVSRDEVMSDSLSSVAASSSNSDDSLTTSQFQEVQDVLLIDTASTKDEKGVLAPNYNVIPNYSDMGLAARKKARRRLRQAMMEAAESSSRKKILITEGDEGASASFSPSS